MGVPLASDAAVLMPGVGCPNACRFCATSHFFDRTYTPFLKDGQAVFDACLKMERELGVNEFFVMDENFLKYPERARELLDLMQRHDKPWRFGIFSSAETIDAVGVEFLARLGVYFLWIGVESKTEVYAKNRGIDLRAMIRSLRDHGITVLASGILFLEHHTKATIWEDIEYLVGLESDFVQFMQLGPMPQTALYRDYAAKGLLRKDLPYEEWHGQHRIWFSHPHFTGAESERFLRDAFRFDYDTQGASLLRMCDTTLRGYETLAKYDGPLMRQRREALRRSAEHLRPALRVLRRFGHNAHVRQLADRVIARYDAVLGGRTLRLRAREIAALAYATREVVRVETGRTSYQPRTRVTRYRASARTPVALEWGTRPEGALRPASP
jgi:haloalkane dehalogenase